MFLFKVMTNFLTYFYYNKNQSHFENFTFLWSEISVGKSNFATCFYLFDFLHKIKDICLNSRFFSDTDSNLHEKCLSRKWILDFHLFFH